MVNNQQPTPNQNVPVYYLGYPGVNTPHVTVVKGNHYISPFKDDGTPDHGAVVLVRKHDLQEFLEHNQYQPKGDPTLRNAYTTDASLGALAKQKGEVLQAPAQMTTAEALNLVDDETLEKLLAARKAMKDLKPVIEPEEPDAESISQQGADEES